MNERRLQQIIRDILMSGFNQQGLPIRVQRSYQQRNHAAPSTPTLVYHRIGTVIAGWQYRNSQKIQTDDGYIGRTTHSSNELITFQFNAIVVEPEPADETVDMLSASDYLSKARMIFMASPPNLKPMGINVLHVTTVADIWIQNESNNWELQPSFDLQIAVKQELVQDVNVVTNLTGHIHRV